MGDTDKTERIETPEERINRISIETTDKVLNSLGISGGDVTTQEEKDTVKDLILRAVKDSMRFPDKDKDEMTLAQFDSTLVLYTKENQGPVNEAKMLRLMFYAILKEMKATGLVHIPNVLKRSVEHFKANFKEPA